MFDAASGGWQVVARWWDGVELWLTQLPLAVQVTLLIAVLLPACWWIARGIDRAVDAASERLPGRYGRDEDSP
ncbi:MAG: hypothetical protein ACRDT0_24800 [Pseudonocardiaceae bacterium]